MDVEIEARTVALPKSGQLYVQQAGRGPTVVLLHGIPGSAASWHAVVPELTGEAEVVVPDLLGFGRSSRPTGIDGLDANAQAAAVLASLDELGVERAVVVGHDFGGPIALTIWNCAPERVAGLVLMATNAHTDTPIPFPLSGLFWPLIGPLWQRLVFSRASLALMLRTGVGPGGPRLAAPDYLGDAAQVRAIGTIFAASLRELERRYGPTEAALGTIAVPTAVLWGERDPFFTVARGQQVAADIPDADFEVLAGAGHFLPAERPAAVAAAVRRILAAIAAA